MDDDRIYDILRRIEDNQCDTQKIICSLPCSVNTFKIGLLQKIVFGSVAIILVTFMGTIFKKEKPNDRPQSQNHLVSKEQDQNTVSILKKIKNENQAIYLNTNFKGEY